jgi:hypothetical protein
MEVLMKTVEILSQYSQPVSQDLNLIPPEFETGTLIT